MPRRLLWTLSVFVMAACAGSSGGSSSSSGAGGANPTGGTGSGGQSATGNGGDSSTGGSSGGSPGAGGVTGTGGVPGAGGTATGGSSAAGGSEQGGGSGTGGAGAGGTSSAGGAAAGGSSAAGGAAAGGSSTGGATGSGGAAGVPGNGGGGGGASTGGQTAAGGATGSGGATGAGGATGVAVHKRFIGNTSPKNKDIPADFAKLWQEVSMDANSKWGFVQPNSADQWVWEPVDKVYQYAKDNNIIFKQHNFFWKVEQPSWVNDSNIMTVGPKWVEAFCKRYPDVPMIDVVNEPLVNHNPPPYTKGMGGTGSTGYDWVITAFKWARQYCPNAILIINEYNIIEWDDDHNAFVAMLTKLLAAGAEIDAIGAQGHDVYKIGAAKAKTYLDKLATFNLPIYITEFEVDQADDAKQKTYMEEAITMFWDYPSIKGITHWGYVKGMMWSMRPNGWLVDTSGKFRPAMTWLQDFMKANAQ